MAKPHGLHGEVVVELYTDRPERSCPGSRFTTVLGELRIERSQRFPGRLPGRWIIAFDGIVDRAGAERVRGVVLSAAPLVDGDAWWVHELIGAAVLQTDGVTVGTVRSVLANPASDLLELDSGALIPLRFVVERRPGAVVVEVPPGLLDV